MIYIAMKGRFPQHERIEQFACDAINYFFPKYSKRDIVVELVMKRSLHHFTSDGYVEQNSGEAGYSDDTVLIHIARNYVSGNGNLTPYDIDELVSAIAHELTHAKQFIKGELSFDSNHVVLGKTVDEWFEKHDHHELPWEQEAEKFESILVDKFWRKQE